MEPTAIQGDIAAQQADALVNAAGTSLEMGSGVAGALRRGAGGSINEEATSKGPIELGDVVVTDGYELDTEYVIHAAAMPHYGDGRATEESIRTATRNTLKTAEELGCESLVFPVLGTGVAGFGFERGAQLICEEISAYESTTLTDVRVIAYTDAEYEQLQTVVDGI